MTRSSSMRPPPIPLNLTENTPALSTPDSTKGKVGRQSFSCAECKRLKLKCSRTWPCQSCEKRGCAQICPTGQMTTGKGKRLILADTEELHQRISQLEVALAKAHAQSSDDPHPLLASPYLFSSQDRERRKGSVAPKNETLLEEDESFDGGLGTLTITGEGEARFVGSFAGSEYLRAEDNGPGPEAPLGNTGLVTPPTSAIVATFNARQPPGMLDALGLGGPKMGSDQLRNHLPRWEDEGRMLVETYWENVNWMYQILPRPMFDTDHLLAAYDPEAPINAHKIACVYFIMAIGVIFDLGRPPFDPRGEELFALGRACMNAVGLEHASPATVQALHLCGTYALNDKSGDGGETFWPILGIAVKVAQSLGLHRDGSAFGLSPYEIAERRQVWWEIITYDRLQALCFGRPCATSNKAADTQYPDPSSGFSADTDGYHRAKYRLISMMERVIDVQTQTASVSVQQVQSLDREFREFKRSVPDTLMPRVPIQSLPLDANIHPHLIIHRLGIRLLVAQCRLLLNRPFFARALGDKPEDPSTGKFGDNFIALYESAQEIVQLVQQLVIYHPSLIARWWFFWFHAFTASVCLAAITIRSPACAFASPALHGMTIVCDIAAVARAGCRAKKGLPILLRLRRRANEALVDAGNGSPSLSLKYEPDNDDDLSHLNSPSKLRRVTSSPRSTKTSPVGNNSPSREPINNSSPQSPGSIATSATLAEPIHYDSTGSLIPMANMNGSAGAVQAPPAALPPLTPSADWSTLIDFAQKAPMSFSAPLQQNDGYPVPWVMNATQFAFSPGSFGSENSPLQSYNPLTMDVDMPAPTYQLQVQPLTEAPRPSTGQMMGLFGDMEEEFDLTTFVNQMGGGELGLDGSWD